jgi:hypothetical protein
MDILGLFTAIRKQVNRRLNMIEVENIIEMYGYPGKTLVGEPASVNEIRKSIGFSTTIEEYAKILGIEYRIYKIEDVE